MLALGKWNVVQILELATLEERCHFQVCDDHGQVALAFTRDGASLVTVGGMTEHTMQVWDARTGRNRSGVKIGESAVCLALTPDEKYIVTLMSGDEFPGTIGVWEAASGRMAFALYDRKDREFRSQGRVLSPDGKLLGACDRRGVLRIWSFPELLAATSGATIFD